MSVTFSPDGAIAATADLAGTVTLWHIGDSPHISGRLKCESVKGIELPCAATCTTFAADRSHLYVGCKDGTIRVVDPRSGEVNGELKGDGGEIAAMALSPNQRLLASVSRTDEAVTLWDTSELKEMRCLRRGTGLATDVTFLTDDKLIVGYKQAKQAHRRATQRSEYPDEEVRVWNVSDGAVQKFYRVGGERAESVGISADRRLLAVGYERATVSAQGGVAIYDLATDKRLATIPAPLIGATARWSPQGRRLLIVDGFVVEVWDLEKPDSPRQVWHRQWHWTDKVDTP